MRKSTVIGLVVVMVLAFAVVPVHSQGGPLTGYKICLDPGHGGSDPGAVKELLVLGELVVLEEKDINLDVAFGLKTILEDDGATVYLTRTDDSYYENRDRYTLCNGVEADILVSVHTNSVADPTWDGTLVLHSPRTTSVDDWSLARALHDSMYDYLRDLAPGGVEEFRDFGLDRFASGVLFKSTMPAAMIEPLFMSHPAEAASLQATINQVDGNGLVVLDANGNPTPSGVCGGLSCRRGQIVQSVSDGILAYFGGGGNQAPVASFTAQCNELACTFDGSASYDPDGTIVNYAWDFGDGASASGPDVVVVGHTYASAGTFEVKLTVSDGEGATGSASQLVTVSSGGAGIALTATGYKVKGAQKADLEWSGAASADVDIYRDMVLVATTPNDGSYTDNIDLRGPSSYVFVVCEAGTDTCSDPVTVVY